MKTREIQPHLSFVFFFSLSLINKGFIVLLALLKIAAETSGLSSLRNFSKFYLEIIFLWNGI